MKAAGLEKEGVEPQKGALWLVWVRPNHWLGLVGWWDVGFLA